MPVTKKTTRGSSKKKAPAPRHDCCFDRGCGMQMHPDMGHGGHMSGAHKILLTLVGVLLAYGIVWMGTLIRNNIEEFQYIGYADRTERTITVDGFAEVEATPDVAYLTMGMRTEGQTVEEAQHANTEVMNQLIARLQEMGIVQEDIETQNYNVYPRYDYSAEERELVGHEVTQNIRITIRDVALTEAVIALSGELGTNQVGGLDFEIDDTAVYEERARQEAMTDAFQKARRLSRMLGVQLVDVVSYSEYQADEGPFPFARSFAAFDEEIAMAEPAIEEGSKEVGMNVSITFEIR